MKEILRKISDSVQQKLIEVGELALSWCYASMFTSCCISFIFEYSVPSVMPGM